MADSVAITKYDGSLKIQARHTKADYSQSIKLTTTLASTYTDSTHNTQQKQDSHHDPHHAHKSISTKIHLISTKDDVGIDPLVDEIFLSFLHKHEQGEVETRRRNQIGYWFAKFFKEQFVSYIQHNTSPEVLEDMTEKVQEHILMPSDAANQLIQHVLQKSK